MNFVAEEAELSIRGKNLHRWWLVGELTLKKDHKEVGFPKAKE